MNALVPITCSITAQTAGKAALLRRIEPASRANEDRQDAPRGQQGAAKPIAPAPTRAAQPAATLVAHILGARDGHASTSGYNAYERANRLLQLESHKLDVTLG